jgi:hypothetical protein
MVVGKLTLLGPSSRFRVLCQTIIAHKLFDYVVLAFIFLNCITIALERPQIEAGSTVSDCSPLARKGARRQRDRTPGPATGPEIAQQSQMPNTVEGGGARKGPLGKEGHLEVRGWPGDWAVV